MCQLFIFILITIKVSNKYGILHLFSLPNMKNNDIPTYTTILDIFFFYVTGKLHCSISAT